MKGIFKAFVFLGACFIALYGQPIFGATAVEQPGVLNISPEAAAETLPLVMFAETHLNVLVEISSDPNNFTANAAGARIQQVLFAGLTFDYGALLLTRRSLQTAVDGGAFDAVDARAQIQVVLAQVSSKRNLFNGWIFQEGDLDERGNLAFDGLVTNLEKALVEVSNFIQGRSSGFCGDGTCDRTSEDCITCKEDCSC